jgi:phosphodiesterase/alkaline phosphatase D-like protein
VKRNSEVLFVEVFHKGFVLTTVTPTAVTGELIGVSTVQSRDFTTRVLKTYRVVHEGETVSKPVEV